MSNKNLAILGIIAGVVVALAIMQSHFSNRPQKVEASPSYLIQGLDPAEIAKITIGRGDEEVILARMGKDFVVKSKDNYPALTSEINKLITSCMDIQTSELYTDNTANHKDLGVTEEDASHLIKFYKADSSGSTDSPQGLLTGVVIGKPKTQSGSGYVRRVGDNRVYVTLHAPWIKKTAIEYVQQELTNVKREDIELVTVSSPNDVYTLKPGGNEKTVVLENMPQGKKLKENGNIANRVFAALTNLKFDDVNAAKFVKGLKFDRKYVCILKDSTVYTFLLAKDGEKWFARCDADFADKTPVTKTQGEVEPEEVLKKKEAKLLARDAAEEFSNKHRGWVYQIADYRAENMTMPASELVEDSTKQGQPANEPNDNS